MIVVLIPLFITTCSGEKHLYMVVNILACFCFFRLHVFCVYMYISSEDMQENTCPQLPLTQTRYEGVFYNGLSWSNLP